MREIKIEQEPTQVTWRRCTQCNAAQMEFQLRENGICQKCYISNLEKENAELSNSVTELTNSKAELENKVTELKTQIEKLKEILSFEEYREQFQKGERTLLGKTINEWLIYQNENEELKAKIEKMKCCGNCEKQLKNVVCVRCKNNSEWELAE